MWQRIQTVYLGLVLVFTLALFYVPVVKFNTNNDVYTLNAAALIRENTSVAQNFKSALFLKIELILIAVISIISIVSYKKRHLQLKLGRFNVFAHFILIGILFFLVDSEFQKAIDPKFTSIYAVGAYLPIINIVLIILANRAIKKDEELVRSAERLR